MKRKELHETSRLAYGRRMTTRPAHIAMFSIALHGHVNPSLEVIRELVARGHRVTYAIPPLLADKVAEAGAEPKLWNSTLPGPDADPEAWGAPSWTTWSPSSPTRSSRSRSSPRRTRGTSRTWSCTTSPPTPPASWAAAGRCP